MTVQFPKGVVLAILHMHTHTSAPILLCSTSLAMLAYLQSDQWTKYSVKRVINSKRIEAMCLKQPVHIFIIGKGEI